MSSICDDSGRHWFAAYTRNNFARKVKSLLDAVGVENYLPMRTVEVEAGGHMRRIERPVISNIVFMRMHREECYSVVNDNNLPVRYILDRDSKGPAVINDKQMADFMFLMGLPEDSITVVTCPLTVGDRVRVTGGPFAGVEGELIRIQGHKRVVVKINDIVSVATAYIPSALLERLG